MPALAQRPTLSDVRQAIVRYLVDGVVRPCISISEVSHAVRGTFPLCELTDWELGDLSEVPSTQDSRLSSTRILETPVEACVVDDFVRQGHDRQ